MAFGAAGVLMLLTAGVNRVVMPHPPERHPQETEAVTAHKRPTAFAFLEAYKSFLTQPKAVLVLSFLLLYRVGDIMMFGQSKPLLRDLGVTTGQRGILNGFSITCTILGSIVGGAIIARKGLARCLVPMAYLQNLAIPLYILMAAAKPALPGIVAIVLAEQFVAGAGAVAFSVFQMQRTRKAFSAAHFAFITAVVSAASMVPGMIRVSSVSATASRSSSPSPFSRACRAWCWCTSCPSNRSRPRPRPKPRPRAERGGRSDIRVRARRRGAVVVGMDGRLARAAGDAR